MTSILQKTKCKWCMYDIWGKCTKENCTLIHPRKTDNEIDIKLLDMLFDLNKNLFTDSYYRNTNTVFHYSEKFLKKHYEKHNIQNDKEKKQVKLLKINKKLLKLANETLIDEPPKTNIGICTRHFFSKECLNCKVGNCITIPITYQDESTSYIDLCYNTNGRNESYFYLCNCDIEYTHSKKGNIYIKDISKITRVNKLSGTNTFLNYLDSKKFGKTPDFVKEERTTEQKVSFENEKEQFPTMLSDSVVKEKPLEWVKKVNLKPTSSSDTAESVSTTNAILPTDDKQTKVDIPKLDIKKTLQREISSSSLSELSSPVRVYVKDFEEIVPTIQNVKFSIPDYIRMLEDVKIEYNKLKEIAKKTTYYYERLQREKITNECQQQSHLSEKSGLQSKFDKLDRDYREFRTMFYESEYLSDEVNSTEEDFSETSSKFSENFSDDESLKF